MQSTVFLMVSLLCVLTPVKCMIEEARLNFKGLSMKYGHQVEDHEVVTEDGYILQLFRIPGDSKRPILLLHGLLDSADSFVIRGNSSLGIVLANAGYDVWVGNFRGNRYSRRHVNLTDKDYDFWNYSFHEGGYYDLPAFIDYVLQTTGVTRIPTVGHSQGATAHFVLLSKRPEYNYKISLFLALAPAVFFTDTIQPIVAINVMRPFLDEFFKSLGGEEFFNPNSTVISVFRSICEQGFFSHQVCLRIIFEILGADPRRVEPNFMKIFVGHYPATTSRKSLVHFGQLITSKRFCEFDYGPKENLKRYGFLFPPDYNLYNVKARVALFAGKNDPLARLKDVKILRSFLPNVVYYHVMKARNWNHIDFIMSNDMAVTVFPLLFKLLEKYL